MSNVKVWLQHIHTEDGGTEPAVCFGRIGYRNKSAYAIGLSAAHKFLDDNYLMKSAFKIAKTLGLEPITKGEVIKIADTILHSLDALVAYKPETEQQSRQREKEEAFGRGYTAEGTMNIDGKEIEFTA